MIRLILLFTFFAFTLSDYVAVSELDLNKYIREWYEDYGDNLDKTFQGNGK